MTKQQQLIYQLILESRDHPTADQLYWCAKQQIPNISVGTIYRNLNQMVEAGVIKRLSIAGEADRFDRSTYPHGHAICQRCGKMIDISMDLLENMIESTLGLDIISYELNVRYICTGCRDHDKKTENNVRE